MHEYSIVAALLDRVEAEARARGASGVHRLSIRIGELAGVDPELLTSAYELVRERTICANADLEIRSTAARWICPTCQRPIARGSVLSCAQCAVPARLAEGDEIILDRIELEVP